jgi:hypothetical protein
MHLGCRHAQIGYNTHMTELLPLVGGRRNEHSNEQNYLNSERLCSFN